MQNRVLQRLTFHIGTLAILAAGLISLGQQSGRLLGLVFASVVLSWIFTDWLKWFRLNKFVAYFLMIVGAMFAIMDYLRGVDSQQLYSVANLLIYVQLPLFFQTKTRRIFEQLGIFLLLELVVAALVNDNVLYGLLLLPVMAVGCSTMVLFAYFISSDRSGEAIGESNSVFARFLQWMGSETTIRVNVSGIEVRLNKESEFRPKRSWVAWFAELVPTNLALFLFALGFFYLLPRINTDSYEGRWRRNVVGFSERISLAQVGEILQSDQVVMRLSFRDGTSNRAFAPLEAPYLRGACLGRYEPGFQRGDWSLDSSYSPLASLASSEQVRPEYRQEFLPVIVSILEQVQTDGLIMGLPPFYASNRDDLVEVFPDTWALREQEQFSSRNRRKIEFGTLSFTAGRQSPFTPLLYDVYDDRFLRSYGIPRDGSALNPKLNRELTRFNPTRFRSLLEYRDEVLSRNNVRNEDIIGQTLAIEEDLALSGKLTYSLNLNAHQDPTLDPIEDFVRNHKKGHCQYFASTMALMLRSMGIPTRVVVGYRPSEFNNVGRFFLVRQKHAHTWVEAFFTREQFDNSTIRLPACFVSGAWLRLDPTPPGNGSNAGGTLQTARSQTFDYAQELWGDYVMDMNKSNSDAIFQMFGDPTSNSFASLFRQAEIIFLRLQQGQLIGGFFAPGEWLNLGILVAVGILILIAVAVLRGFRWVMPSWIAFGKRRAARPYISGVVSFPFLRQMLKMLERVGWKRPRHQTLREFVSDAEGCWQANVDRPLDPKPLSMLTSIYYRLRFGEVRDLSPSDQSQVDSCLESLAAHGTSALSRARQARNKAIGK